MRFLPLLPALAPLAALLASCASMGPVTTLAYSPTTCSAVGIADGDGFVAKKVLRVTAFDPEAVGADYALPVTTTTLPAGVAASLARVFNAAPPFFRNHLCGLTAVLVDSSSAGRRQQAYGFFEGPNQGTHSNAFIGLPIGVFRGSDSFEGNETDTLSELVKGWGTSGERPRISTEPQQSRTLIVAGQLAHEMGHILWQNRGVLSRGGCDFLSTSWDKVAKDQPWPFHRFGDPEKGSEPKGPGRNNLVLSNRAGRVQAGQDLQAIYTSKQWASLFATVSPDEDWIETYRLLVLTHLTSGPLSSLRAQNGPSARPFDVDIVSDLATATPLATKAACVARQAGG